MAGKSSQILETVLSVVDRASDKIKRVERDAKALEDLDPTIQIDADDNASDDIKDVTELADKYDGRTAEVKLKAEKKLAERDIRKLTRDLADVDSTEAEAEILADITAAEKRLKTIDDELDKLDRKKVEPKVETGDMSRQGDNAGGMFGGGFAGALGKAGVVGAVAGALTKAFNAGIERIQLQARFRSQFGLVERDAERLGKQAGEIYADGFGDSLAEVQRSLGLIQQQLVGTRVVAEAETGDISEAALAMANVFGVDVAEIIRSVGQLLKNGLAADADEALDLITSGFQNGANTAGDFLETIDEYSQHWAAFGLSGEDALNVIIAGFQGGQRDADKLADAIKEMRIRTVEESDAISAAYAELGVDADEYRAKILAGGDSAREAFREIIAELRAVEDPVRQNALAVELIGTQYEDLGPKALDALAAIDLATRDITQSTEDLVDSQEESTSELRRMWRNVSEAFGDSAEAWAGFVNDVADGGGRVVDAMMRLDELDGKNVAEAREWLEQFNLTVEDSTGLLEAWAEQNGLAVTSTTAVSSALVQQSIDAGLAEVKLENLARSTEAKEQADDDATNAAEEHARAMEEQAEQAEELTRQMGRLIGGSLGVERAQIRAADAADEYNREIQQLNKSGLEGEELERRKRDAFINAAEAQLDAAQAAANYAIEQREANGEVVSAAQRNAELANQLRTVAGTLAPGSELRRQLNAYASELDSIPGSVNSSLRVNVDEPALAAARRRIEQILGRPVTIRPNTYTPNAPRPQGGVNSYGAAGGIVNGPTRALIGEAGPEALVPLDQLPGNSPLPPNLGGGGGPVYNITVNAGMGANGSDVGREIVDHIKRFERANGTRWRS